VGHVFGNLKADYRVLNVIQHGLKREHVMISQSGVVKTSDMASPKFAKEVSSCRWWPDAGRVTFSHACASGLQLTLNLHWKSIWVGGDIVGLAIRFGRQTPLGKQTHFRKTTL